MVLYFIFSRLWEFLLWDITRYYDKEINIKNISQGVLIVFSTVLYILCIIPYWAYEALRDIF